MKQRTGYLPRFDISDFLSWVTIPLIVILAVILLYNLVLVPIQPGSMEANILGSSQIGFKSITDAVIEHLRLILISTLLAIATGVPAGVLITREGVIRPEDLANPY